MNKHLLVDILAHVFSGHDELCVLLRRDKQGLVDFKALTYQLVVRRLVCSLLDKKVKHVFQACLLLDDRQRVLHDLA